MTNKEAYQILTKALGDWKDKLIHPNQLMYSFSGLCAYFEYILAENNHREFMKEFIEPYATDRHTFVGSDGKTYKSMFYYGPALQPESVKKRIALISRAMDAIIEQDWIEMNKEIVDVQPENWEYQSILSINTILPMCESLKRAYAKQHGNWDHEADTYIDKELYDSAHY